MNWTDLRLRVRSLIFRRRVERELQEELDFHLAMETRKNLLRDMNQDEAKRQALLKFGGAAKIAEDCRDQRRVNLLENLMRDFRDAFRTIRRNPGFTAVAVFSIAIGIGANSAMFSIADAVLLRPLPVAKPNEVLTVGPSTTLIRGVAAAVTMSYPDYIDLKSETRCLENLVAYTFLPVGFAERPDTLPKLTMIAPVTDNFFSTFGVNPTIGRGFRPDENTVPERNAVAVIDYDIWNQQFGADTAILGRKVWLGGTAFTIVGVAPERLRTLDAYIHPAFYVPMMMSPRLMQNRPGNLLTDRNARSLIVKARLKPNTTLGKAQDEVRAIAANLERSYPDTNENVTFRVLTEIQTKFQQNPADSQLAAALLVLAGCVLLAACGNVAGLLTSRSPLRAREIALRMAMGANRYRLVRQLLIEAVLLALLGGVLGLTIGYAGVALFSRVQIASDLPIWLFVSMDSRVLWESFGVALSSAILFGLVPAIQATRTDLTSTIKGVRPRYIPRLLWGRSVLVTAQITVALVLLTIATLVYQGFRLHLSNSPGFRTDHLVTMEFDPSLVGYTQAQTQQFYERLLARARMLPGLRSAALGSHIPFSPQPDLAEVVPEGFELPPGEKSVRVLMNRVDESYFQTMGIHVIQGREFVKTDAADSPLVAVVNEQLAQRYWPGQNPIGKRLRYGDSTGPWVEVVGVAQTSKYIFIVEQPQEFVYFPWRQHPRRRMVLLAHSWGSSAALVGPLRELIRELDAAQPVYNIRTMEDLYQSRAVTIANVITEMVGSMGLMGVVLALLGLYGLVSYSVRRRTREIAIRIAVGAQRNQVLNMVLARAAMLGFSGITLGLVGSFWAGKYLQSIFSNTYTMRSTIATCSLVAAALLVVTIAAAYIPARRATRVDPLVALRHE